jgi:Xaa-Pro dipeptidase
VASELPTSLPAREQALWDAQQRAEDLFELVIQRGLLQPGRTESEVSAAIFELARQECGVRRHWHRRVVRCGANTLLTYYEEGPDRRIEADDLVFLDFGPVFAGWEADLGRSYVVGADPAKRRLVSAIGAAFRSGQDLYESTPELTAGELYDHVASLAIAGGWRFGAASAGHPVDAFPHERSPGRRYVIEHGNPHPLRQPLADGRRRHWILEIHFVDEVHGYGAFCEELLTVRGVQNESGCATPTA